MFESALNKTQTEELSKVLTKWKFLVNHMDRRFGMFFVRKAACGEPECTKMTVFVL